MTSFIGLKEILGHIAEISYISNRNRNEYSSRPKSIPGAQPPAPTSLPTVGTVDQRKWDEDSLSDTRNRPPRSRSRTREATRRDSSTESNDASSPVQQRQHYQHPQMPPQQHHVQQQVAPQQQQQVASQPQQQQTTVRVGPHPLPAVRLAR
nr:uncharacterized protein LOC128687122 [Cherax quadricarinatus]